MQVLEDAQYLSDNAHQLRDPDENIRKDLRHLRCYAVDREGASEVDDAFSIEYLADGSEKLWVHIADVSRWVQPNSLLAVEAERRMVSSKFVYSLPPSLLLLLFLFPTIYSCMCVSIHVSLVFTTRRLPYASSLFLHSPMLSP